MSQSNIGDLQVVHLTVENVMGIKSADVEIGAAELLYGQNGAGKTSLYRALAAAFEGIPAELITRGEAKAQVLLRLAGAGDEKFEIRRSRDENGQKIRVTDRNGSTIPRPSEFLSGLLGDFSLDPARFALSEGEEQVRLFCNAFRTRLGGEDVERLARRYNVDLSVNGFLALDRIVERLEEDRRNAGVEKRKAEAVAEEFKPEDPTIVRPSKEAREESDREVAEATAELRTIEERRRVIEGRNRYREELAAAVVSTEASVQRELDASAARIDKLEDDLERIKAEIQVEHESRHALVVEGAERVKAAKDRRAAEGRVEAFPSADTARERLAQATARQASVRALDEAARAVEIWQEKKDLAEARAAEWKALDEAINKGARDAWLSDLWSQIKAPIAGLALGRDAKGKPCLTLKGIPLSTVNTAARVQVGVQIAARLNADYPVRILAVDDGEHLTRSNREALLKEAARCGFQVVMLVAADPEDVPPGGLILREGTVTRIERSE